MIVESTARGESIMQNLKTFMRLIPAAAGLLAVGCATGTPICETGFQSGRFTEISWCAPLRFVDTKRLNPIDDIVRYEIYLDGNTAEPIATASP